MKFSEFPYERPDYPKLMETISQLTERFEKAASASEQIEIIKELEQLRIELTTNVQICTIRYTVDTRDPFYSQEEEYNEQMAPVLDEKLQEFNKALVASPFRKELEKEFGSLMFKNIEISLKSFSPELIPLIQEENQLVQQYQKLCASAKIEFDGKVCNLAQLVLTSKARTARCAKPLHRHTAAFLTSIKRSLMTSMTVWSKTAPSRHTVWVFPTM